MKNYHLKYFLSLVIFLALSSLITGYGLKTFVSAIFGIFLWTNTIIPRYFEKFSLSVNFFLISIIYILININGNIFLLYDLETVLAPTLILLPAFYSILDSYLTNKKKILSFFLVPVFFLITLLTSTNAFFLGISLGLVLVYLIPLFIMIIKKFFKFKILNLSTIFKITTYISTKTKKYDLTKNIILIIVGMFIFIYLIGMTGFLRITGGRELIWLGHLYHTRFLCREINNIISAPDLASRFGLIFTLDYYKNTSTSIFVTNPHSMLIGTLTKFGYIPGLIALTMVYQNIKRITKDVPFCATQYIAFIILVIYALLNGKGFLSINEYSIASYVAFLSILNTAKIKNCRKQI